ncbi:MAG TPA: hypothetical protein VEA63_10085, partial [Opitutus sp.]|nr:hypothetical protein [Opitutus sp.]
EQLDSPPSGEYTWPIQAVRLAVVLLFLGSGISKLVLGGWPWMFSDNLYNIVSYCQLTRDTPLQIDIQSSLFYRTLAVGTVVIELAAPLALFHRASSTIIIPALLGMQIGIRLIMGDNFTQFMSLYLFWVPWMSLIVLVRRTSLSRNDRSQPVLGKPLSGHL